MNKTYIVPVEWAMCGVVAVEASSAEEACKKISEDNDHISVPGSVYADYIDGSFCVPEPNSVSTIEQCNLYTEMAEKDPHFFHLLNNL